VGPKFVENFKIKLQRGAFETRPSIAQPSHITAEAHQLLLQSV